MFLWFTGKTLAKKVEARPSNGLEPATQAKGRMPISNRLRPKEILERDRCAIGWSNIYNHSTNPVKKQWNAQECDKLRRIVTFLAEFRLRTFLYVCVGRCGRKLVACEGLDSFFTDSNIFMNPKLDSQKLMCCLSK